MTLDTIKLRVVAAALLELDTEPFSGRIFRATPAEVTALQGASSGRWAPGSRGVVLDAHASAEAAVSQLLDQLDAGDALAAARKQALHQLSLSAGRLVRLTSAARLRRLGVSEDFMAGQDFEPTQRVARAAYQLGIEGLIVPGVGADPTFVLFPGRLASDALVAEATTRLSPLELRNARLTSIRAQEA